MISYELFPSDDQPSPGKARSSGLGSAAKEAGAELRPQGSWFLSPGPPGSHGGTFGGVGWAWGGAGARVVTGAGLENSQQLNSFRMFQRQAYYRICLGLCNQMIMHKEVLNITFTSSDV